MGTINYHLNFTVTAGVFACAGGRALGSVISKFNKFRNIGYTTFTKRFETSLLPVLEYGSEILGFKENMKCEWVQQRAAHYYLGAHSKLLYQF